MAPFAAVLIERYGLKRVILSAFDPFSCGLLLALAMSQIVGIGRGTTALVMAAIVSTRWSRSGAGWC